MSFDMNNGGVDESLSALDRSVVGSLEAAEFARQGARVLRYIAVGVVVCAIVGEYLINADRDFKDLSAGRKIGSFLSGVATPLAIAGLIAAASLLVTAYVAGLELNSIGSGVADDDDTGGLPAPTGE